MKKIIISLLMVILLVGCNTTSNNNENKEKPTVEPKNETKVVINLFHWNQCSHCKEEIKWLKEVTEKNDNIEVVYYEVNEYTDLNQSVRDELGIQGAGVPLTVIGTDYILGFGDSTKAKIMNLVDKYKEIDYCDIVSLIVDGADTTDCYLKNM